MKAPRYRFDKPVVRPNETPEQATLRRLEMIPERHTRDPKTFLASIRAQVRMDANKLRREASEK